MSDETGKEGGVPDPPLTEFWWLHDARWYQGVMQRFGQQAANEINAEAIRFVFERVARWYTKVHGLNFSAMPMEEFVRWFEEIPKVSWSERLMDAHYEVRGPDEWDTVVTKHFNLRMLRAARALDGYECPCLEMRAGWFEGMGVTVRDSCVECKRHGAPVCRFRGVLERGGTEQPGAASEESIDG